MKNGMLIWNVILSLAVAVLLVLHFGSTGKKSGGKISGSDTLMGSGHFRIAYFEMDSIAAGTEEVKALKLEIAKKESDMESELAKLSNNLQQRILYFQKLEKEGKLSQEEAQAAGVEINKMNEDIKARKEKLEQDYNEFMVRSQTSIKKQIKDFIKKYNDTKKYTYVFSDDPGLFYYQDTTYNITADVIRGLNQQYKPVKTK